MFILEVEIKREGYYGYGTGDPLKPLKTKIKVAGQNTETVIDLPPHMNDALLALIAEFVAEAGRSVAEQLTAEAMTHKALPSPVPHEASALDDEIPF